MTCTSVSISWAAAAVAASPGTGKETSGMHRSDSSGDLRCDLGSKIRRSRSEPQLRCSLVVPKATAAMKSSRSIGMFPFSFPVPFFDSDESSGGGDGGGGEIGLMDHQEESEGIGKDKRANWVERLLELRTRWRDRQQREEDDADADHYCGVGYESEEETVMEDEEWDPIKFEKLLTRVPWSETKLFSKLAFLCNMAYVIPEIKGEDLRKYYDLRLVTSSLEKKSEAAIKARLDSDSTRPHPDPIGSEPAPAPSSQLKRPIRPSVAYEIAASAASYVRSRAKGLLSLGGRNSAPHEPGGSGGDGDDCDVCHSEARGERVYKSEVAAFVAASTMTAMVAAEEEARLEAVRGLRSLQSSPCEWFVCDDPNTCTRCFVIQGSDSLASWQANLLFEPTKFEETEVLVHRGIYEAAKGIYEQFMPEILAHLRRYGDQAKFRFIGHSLGGSLSLLVNLMLRARGAIPPSSLLPVVTFGSPSVFCGGRRVIDGLGIDDGHICSVMMHRDIVPRAFSCNYPNHVAQLLKRLNGAFRSHPCLNSEKVLYSPLGKLFILQPDEKSSPHHPLLPPGAAVYSLNTRDSNGAPIPGASSALKAFLNSPHPLETLSKPTAYGSDGTILRDHDSSNYLKAINGLIRQHTKSFVRRSRKQKLNYLWPLLTSTTWAGHRESSLEKPAGLVPKEVVTRV